MRLNPGRCRAPPAATFASARLAQIRHRIDERNLERQEGVRSVLDDLRALGRGQQQWRRGIAGRTDSPEWHLPGRIIGAVCQRRVNLLQQLRPHAALSAPTTIRSGCRKSSTAVPSRRNSGLDTTSNKSCDRTPFRSMDSPDPLVGVDGHRAFFHNDLIAV